MNNVINNKLSGLMGNKLVKISQVSQETGISRTTLTSLYYRRSTAITFEVLDKLCNYFHCSIDDIFEFQPTN